MEQVTDKMRVGALGGGMAQQAAMAKMLRQRQLDAIIDQASAAAAPMQPPPAQQPMQGAGGGMAQSTFSGYGAPRPPQSLQQQMQLRELLRRQGQMLPPSPQ